MNNLIDKFTTEEDCINYYLQENNVTKENIRTWFAQELFCIRTIGTTGITSLRTFKRKYNKYYVINS